MVPWGIFKKIKIALLVTGVVAVQLLPAVPAGAVCDLLANDKGQLANPFNVETAGQYRVWLRMWAPAASSDSVFAQVDDQCPVVAGDAASSDKDFIWVSYLAGDQTKPFILNLAAGAHTINFAGRELNAGVDKVMVLADVTCVPTEFGDNCLATAQEEAGPITPGLVPTSHQQTTTQMADTINFWVVGVCAAAVLGAFGFLVWKYLGFMKQLRLPNGLMGEATVGGGLHPEAKFPTKLAHFLRHHRLAVFLSLVVIATAVVVGIVAAADDRPIFEAEAGRLSGGAQLAESALASQRKYVVFQNNPVTSQSPNNQQAAPQQGGGGGSSQQGGNQGGGDQGGGGGDSGGDQGGGGAAPAGYPAAYNTGYPHGLSGDVRAPVTLTPYSGPCTITTPGTVIDSKDITCRINIRAANVVIKNSRIRVSNEGAVNINDVYHAVIMDTELDGQRQDNSAGGISLIGDGSYTCLRCDLHSSGDIARINWGGVAIVDSYLHDPYCLQSSCHNDVMQSTGWTDSCDGPSQGLGPVGGSSDATGSSYCIRIVHNRLENPNTQTSNILLKADQGAIHDVLVENNLFNGGGYTFYWYDSGYQISNGIVRNNRFRRAAGGGFWPNGGYYGPVASNVGDSARYPAWTNNVWDDNGAAISF